MLKEKTLDTLIGYSSNLHRMIQSHPLLLSKIFLSVYILLAPPPRRSPPGGPLGDMRNHQLPIYSHNPAMPMPRG